MIDRGALLDAIPHRPPMRLIDSVLELGPGRAVCRAVLDPRCPLVDAGGSASPLLVIELFAQTAAVLMAAGTLQAGAAPKGGMLLGAPELDVDIDRLLPGQELRIVAQERFRRGALSQLECAMTIGGRKVARGRINVVEGQGRALAGAT